MHLSWPRARQVPSLPQLREITPPELALALANQTIQIIDLRTCMAFRQAHIAEAKWSIRPRAATIIDHGKQIALKADKPEIAALAAIDLQEAGARDIRLVCGGAADWRAAGFSISATPNDPNDADAIDFLFFLMRAT